jgi:hypothetical protein
MSPLALLICGAHTTWTLTIAHWWSLRRCNARSRTTGLHWHSPLAAGFEHGGGRGMYQTTIDRERPLSFVSVLGRLGLQRPDSPPPGRGSRPLASGVSNLPRSTREGDRPPAPRRVRKNELCKSTTESNNCRVRVPHPGFYDIRFSFWLAPLPTSLLILQFHHGAEADPARRALKGVRLSEAETTDETPPTGGPRRRGQ